MGKNPGPTQLLKTLRLFIFEKKKKNIEKLGENRKIYYFQKLFYIELQKFQALRLFQTPRSLALDIFSRPHGYLQPHVSERDKSP